MSNFRDAINFLEDITSWLSPGIDCVVYRDGKQIFRHQAGYADVETKTPFTAETLFYLYSASKVVTCTAALQLLEKGKIILTDPVSEYLPEFADMTVKRMIDGKEEIVKAKTPMNIGHLFSMTAGLDYELDAPEIKAVQEKTKGVCPTREIVRAIAQRPLSFEPGAHWQYSLCHDVLGALIEVVSGKSFGEYLKENIFEPLGMKNTGFAFNEQIADKMASQYQYNDEKHCYENIGKKNRFCFGSRYESGGAGLISCVDDYIMFANALCCGGKAASGEQILSRAAIDLMRTNRLDATTIADMTWEHLLGYGYGLGVRTMIDRTIVGALSPVGEFGWSGAAGAYALIDVENRVAIFAAQHILNGKNHYVHPRLRNVIYKCL